MITKNRKKNNKKLDNLLFCPKKSKKSAENTQFFDENTRASENGIHSLVNRSRALHNPEDKKHLDNHYYAHHNYKSEQIPLDSICEETLLKGYQFVPGEFIDKDNTGIRNAKNWKSQRVFLIEFDDTTENTLAEFIAARPFLKENAYLVTESIRSRYNDPDDDTCNGQLRPRLVFCMPRAVNTTDERQWVYDALVKELPGCDKGSANSITNGGLGKVNAEHIKIGKIVDTDWFNSAIATGQQEKADEDKAKRKRAEERKRKQEERAAMGFTKREGELPLEALAKAEPSLFLESLGLSLKSVSGQYQYWGRTEKQGDTALSVWQSDRGNWQIRVFANSIPVPPSVSGAMPFTRFYCYHELHTDIEGLQPDSHQWKDINSQLAHRGYGTWLSDEEFHAQNTANIKSSENPTRSKAKLQRQTDTEPEPTESREANHANREEATDTFFTAETATETLHLLLVKDSTGTGKTHTLISKAQQHEKRTLAQLPHTDLARQAVNIAWEKGYKNPIHLVGREHNWDDSGIADIPANLRTPDLFSRNNCIMVDKGKKYTDKRIPHRTYCEHQCDFRQECPHLAQYEGLGERDFVASCSPNLLFDLNLRGYLRSLVTATSEPTDDELAIDAILGTESEPTGMFDFAILDDYGINGLYTDVSFTQSEFKALKKAWRGTPTADFAKLMIKAFRKKKPKAIVKALRNAYDSTKDFHTDIAENLTQHARTGFVEYAERPKASKESERLLSEKIVHYEDGGTQFIPVDFDAYKELTEKSIPTINCYHLETEDIGAEVRIPHTPTLALSAGVPLEMLTPIWQAGATPIELLNIFLASIGNDKNAPINRSFRAGDDPEPVLTFSISPQAPVGILPNIAMLSATTDPADTKQAFDGQSVTFSEHEGGILEWAEGVNVYQFTDARLTSASVFDYPRSADGKRQLQQTPIGLTATAEKRLAKLNEWAKATEGLTAFISYKEFTEAPFSEAVNGFDIVTHFDKVAGLNFDGLKFLVVFGYPKVKHDVVMDHARRQYASDSEPLPKGSYEELTTDITETGNGITSTERRYLDPRLEKIRHQLSTEKLEQALGRARFPVWTDTTTIYFTSAPLTSITGRATFFSSEAFNLAATPSELQNAMERIQAAMESGDVKAVMDTQDLEKSQAYEITKKARQQEKAKQDADLLYKAEALIHKGMSQIGVAKMLGISRGKLQALLKKTQAA